MDIKESLSDIKNGVDGMIRKQLVTDQRVDSLESSLRMRKMALAAGGAGTSLPGVEHYPFSFAKATVISALTNSGQLSQNKELLNSHEYKVMCESTQKALDSGTTSPGGGYVIPSQVMTDIIQLTRAQAQVLSLGVTVLPDLKGSPVHMPKQLSAGSIAWYAQNQTITLSDSTYGDVMLTPKIAAMRCQFSNLLNILSNPAMEELIRRDFARVLALEIDRVILEGSGVSGQPMGILNMPGTQAFAIGTNGGIFGWDQATDFLGMLEDANIPQEKIGIAWHPATKRMLKKAKVPQYSGDTAGAYVVPPFVSDQKLRDTLGIPFANSTQLATNLTKGSGNALSRVYGANWSEIVLGMWGSMELMATSVGGSAWTTNSVEVRLIQNLDVAARHTASVVICQDARSI